jgi:surface antigen
MRTLVASICVTIAFANLLPPVANSQQPSAACPALGPKAIIGAATGAAAGAALGAALGGKNRELGAAVGGLGGGLVGGAIGSSLDQRDCQQAQMALQQMSLASTGQQIPWSDPATGNHGSFTPLSDPTKTADGRICRQYHRDAVTKDGQQTDGGIGITCRTANGDWQAVS